MTAYAFVPMYSHALDAAAHLLAKGAEHAAAKGVSETELLDWRLIDDMQPLSFQLMVVVNFTRQWPARVAALPVPEAIASDLHLAEFQNAIVEAKTWLAALKPEQFEHRDEVPLTHELGTGMIVTLPGARWLAIFVTTNVFFHLSTAYDILRARGVPIGKTDLFPGGL